MRTVIIIVVLIMTNNIVGARRIMPKNYMKNLNKSINNMCNKKAYMITNNINIFNCLNTNNDCKSLENYTEYYKIKTDCINNYQQEFLYGMFISLCIWFLLGFALLK